MARVKLPLLSKGMREVYKKAMAYRKATKPFEIEATVTGTVTISLRAKSERGAMVKGKNDLLIPNPDIEYSEFRHVVITKVTQGKDYKGRWMSEEELMGGKRG